MCFRYSLLFLLMLVFISCESKFAPSVEGGYASKPVIAPIDSDLMLPSDDLADSYTESSPEEIRKALEDLKNYQESTQGPTDVRLDKPIRPNASLQGWVKGEPCGFGGEYDGFGFCCTTKNFTAEPEYKCVLDLTELLGDNSTSDNDNENNDEDREDENPSIPTTEDGKDDGCISGSVAEGNCCRDLLECI